MQKRGKLVIYLATGSILLAILARPTLAWHALGFAEHEAEVKTHYARIEAAGFPLDASSYASTFAVPQSENNGQELYEALVSVEAEMMRLWKSDPNRKNSQAYRFKDLVQNKEFKNSAKVAPTDSERLAAFAKLQPLIKKIKAASRKPYYVPNLDWNRPEYITREDLTGYREIMVILNAEARLHAKLGNRAKSLDNLQLMNRLISLSVDTPSVLGTHIHFSMNAGFAAALTECATLDPAGAAHYRQLLTKIKPPNISKSLYSEVFYLAGSMRNQMGNALHKNATDTKLAPKVTSEPNHLSPQDLPDSSISRAYLGYALKYWAPIFAQLRPNGTIINKKQLEDALNEADKATDLDDRWLWAGTPVGMIHMITFSDHRALLKLQEQYSDILAHAYVACHLIETKHRTGSYPTNLADAGVSEKDPMTPNLKTLGYATSGKTAEIWIMNQVSELKLQKVPQNKWPERAYRILP